MSKKFIKLKELGKILDVKSFKNWQFDVYFLGAYKDVDGEWNIPYDEVVKFKEFQDKLKERNKNRDLTPPFVDEYDMPPLFNKGE